MAFLPSAIDRLRVTRVVPKLAVFLVGLISLSVLGGNQEQGSKGKQGDNARALAVDDKDKPGDKAKPRTLAQAAKKLDPKKILVGKWKVDWNKSAELTTSERAAAALKASGQRGAGLVTQFMADGKEVRLLTGVNGRTLASDGRWKVLKSEGKRITVERISDDKKASLQITIVDDDLITYRSGTNASIVMAMRRVKGDKKPVGETRATLIITFPPGNTNDFFQGAHHVAVSPDGRKVISAHYGSRTQLWDVENKRPAADSRGHHGDVMAVGFSHNGKFAYTADWKSLKLWDTATGKPTGTLSHALREDTTIGPTIGSGGRVATRSTMKSAQVWDVATAKPVTEPLESDEVIRALRFSPDGRWLIGETGRQVRVWNIKTGKLAVGPLRHAGYGAAISRNGKLLATSNGNSVEIRETASGRMVGKPLVHGVGGPSESLPGRVGSVPAIRAEFGADGVLLTRDGTDAWFWFGPGTESPRRLKLPMGGRMKAATFLGKGRRAVTVSQNEIAVWQVDVASPIWRTKFKNGSWRTQLTVSRDGQWLLVHTRARESVVYAADTGEIVARDNGAIAAHIGGGLFVTGSKQGTKVWRLPQSRVKN